MAQLLNQMSLEEKIGQMIQADIASISPADLRVYKLGSILAGGNAAPGNNVRTTAAAWLDMVDDYYRASLNNGESHRAIPILFGIDAVHGNAKLLGATIFPHNVGLGAAHDRELMLKIGQATAAEVSAVGIDWTFAPTVAVVRDVRWGRSYESYSESPTLVADYAAQVVTGLQGQHGTAQFMSPGHTLSSVKHFVGDGGTLSGRDQGDTIVPERELSAVHAAAYPAAIKAGAMIVMASYNSWNGAKLHGNHYLLTDILKERLAFDGFVVGDWNAQEQVPGCTKYRCAAAILAGVDMLMAPDSWKALFENTLAQTRAGEIPMARIDEAVTRILRVKVTAGMFERPRPKERSDMGQLGSAAHRALARQAVRESLVLLKNDHATLPLNPRSRILVAGDAADSIGAQTGGWTIDWQGDHNRNPDFPGATSIYAGIKAAVQAAGGSVELREDGQFREKPDAAIIVFGEQPYAEFQGDRETLEFSPNDKHALKLLRKLRAAGIPTVAVFLSGRPLWTNREINASDAFVAAWLPGSEGEGVADVLFQSIVPPAFDFTGRLAFSWPQSAMPVAFDSYGHVTGALFSIGSGLDYQSKPKSTQLSEDPAIPIKWRASPGSLFHSGHPTSPWSIFVSDGGDEVHLTTRRQESPHAAIAVELAFDGAVTAKWTGISSGIFKFSGRPADLRAAANQGAALAIRYRVDQVPEGHVSVGMLSGTMLDLTRTFKTAAPGQWRSLTIPLSCLAAGGADLKEVAVPLAIETSGKFVLSIADAKVAPKASRVSGCTGGSTG
ncbi:MAG: exo 1,3/1,4-beta-D-glucan glucohydrolase [Pseudomonadota bacterium]|nr:exo 1,3/1,4-beta-D-glucan glucohydrolase [Pseudomonadota bacterium]